MQIAQWEHAGLNFEGLSLAGIRTAISLPQLSLSFDIAQGLPHSIGMNTFLITHGHMDHASGIPYVISQKAMHSHQTPRLIMPKSIVGPIQEIMKQWSKIEGHTYKYELVGINPGDEVSLGQRHFIRAFSTVHRIPSMGYSVYRKFRKLRSELAGESSAKIAEFREHGEDPTEERNELQVSFTGDTQIEFLDLNPEVAQARILMMEVTYLDGKKSIQSARDWGHTHLDELIPRLDSIMSEKIVLIHSSARYSLEEADRLLKKRLPAKDLERVILFPGR